MKLLRVQVPEFRALKNVDISFEPDFKPNIFPLASQNGGGKSTLLQLIFALLNCATSKERFKYCRNFLNSINLPEKDKTLAIIDILYKGKLISLTYNILIISKDNPEIYKPLANIRKDIEEALFRLLSYTNISKELIQKGNDKKGILKHELNSRISNSIFLRDSRFYFDQEALNHAHSHTEYLSTDYLREKYRMHKIEDSRNVSFDSVLKFLSTTSPNTENMYSNFEGNFFSKTKKIFLGQLNSFDINHQNTLVMLCISSEQQQRDTYRGFLKEFRDQIYLSVPETQLCLLTSKKSRQSLFDNEGSPEYQKEMQRLRRDTPGFFTPTLIPTDIILKEFEKSRDEDFKHAVKTGGDYGDNYTKLTQDIKSLLVNKRIGLDPSADSPLSRIKVFLEEGDESREIYPEDLSHGELKQLSLYMWLRNRNIKDAVVLMDEIEIALHPDWQYQIIKDLEEWGPSNQYILATHSYELCTALTPSHVKEIEPKLSPSRNHESE